MVRTTGLLPKSLLAARGRRPPKSPLGTDGCFPLEQGEAGVKTHLSPLERHPLYIVSLGPHSLGLDLSRRPVSPVCILCSACMYTCGPCIFPVWRQLRLDVLFAHLQLVSLAAPSWTYRGRVGALESGPCPAAWAVWPSPSSPLARGGVFHSHGDTSHF